MKRYAIVTTAAGIGLYAYFNLATNYFGMDWDQFYASVRQMLAGHSPYTKGIFTPIWGLGLLVPFVLTGMNIGRILLYAFNLFTLLAVAWRFQAKTSTALLVMLSPFAMIYLHHVNIDSFVLWGLVVPAPIGPFLLLIKPQTGMMAFAYFALRAWRDRGLTAALLGFGPAALALGLNLLFGIWSLPRVDRVLNASINTSLFPWSLPVGVVLLVLAWVRRQSRYAAAASPFCSPYVGWFGSWIVTLFAVVDDFYWTFGAVVVSWVWLFLASYFSAG